MQALFLTRKDVKTTALVQKMVTLAQGDQPRVPMSVQKSAEIPSSQFLSNAKTTMLQLATAASIVFLSTDGAALTLIRLRLPTFAQLLVAME